MRIHSAEFITSATNRSGWPKLGLPEIAFAGRSNVGKSSLINRLLNRKGLVKTSAEPGKTRLLNFFLINGEFVFTDLPGYGYAKGDKEEIRRWKPMVEEYLREREELRGLIHIVDIRREPDELENMLWEFSGQTGFRHLTVANKSDKLSRSACLKSVHSLEKRFGTKPIVCSAKTGSGKDELWKELRSLLEN